LKKIDRITIINILVGTIQVKIVKENAKIVNVEMSQPLPTTGEKFKDLKIIAQLLSVEETDLDDRLPIISMSAGVPFIYIPLYSVDAMKKIQFRQDIWEKYFKVTEDFKHIFTFTTNTGDLPADVYSRMFAPAMGIN
jgi:trans-2,3-dihydro-3-hydroxyanthranilate isomerase